jgi:1,4-dihydroxy-6-naphthoate synthase
MKENFSLGYSPCPNDTFIFSALAERRIDPAPYDFDIRIADVEELNRRALEGRLDISKVSTSALLHLLKDYVILRAGGALGRGCGPLVVAREPFSMADLRDRTIAIPGKMTTAHMLLQLHGGFRGPRREMSFEKIMPAVARGDVDAGVIIHEGRFTYRSLDLHRVLDLGEWWEREKGLPLPLGAIIMKRSHGAKAARGVEEKIRESLISSMVHPEAPWPYIVAHAQEMEPEVIREHISTFVNDFSLDVGEEGERAVGVLLDSAARLAGVSLPESPLFRVD